MKLPEQIRDGMMMSFDPKVIETAKAFMIDNGFKTSTAGKGIACSAVADFYADEPELSAAVQTAIIAL